MLNQVSESDYVAKEKKDKHGKQETNMEKEYIGKKIYTDRRRGTHKIYGKVK